MSKLKKFGVFAVGVVAVLFLMRFLPVEWKAKIMG